MKIENHGAEGPITGGKYGKRDITPSAWELMLSETLLGKSTEATTDKKILLQNNLVKGKYIEKENNYTTSLLLLVVSYEI
jgi:hypothetical protein